MKMDLKRALEVFEYNKAMLTCDMSIWRDPEHQDVSPDYYGKDAEDLYYAIVCAEEYIKNAIPIEWMEKTITELIISKDHKYSSSDLPIVYTIISKWRKEHGQ